MHLFCHQYTCISKCLDCVEPTRYLDLQTTFVFAALLGMHCCLKVEDRHRCRFGIFPFLPMSQIPPPPSTTLIT